MKRMMLSNFASVVGRMNEIKEKQSILGKIVELFIKANSKVIARIGDEGDDDNITYILNKGMKFTAETHCNNIKMRKSKE